ncbi:MAG TPA: serine/threonine-protein kinase [Xanthomonadaceae bacterium]|jgi:serine/threonine protein kinase
MTDHIDTTQWQRLGELFDRAIGLDAAGREDLLRSIEREDAGLGRALASLLDSDARHHGLTAQYRERLLQDSLEAISGPDLAVGDRIGPYVLRENLGQGGMGVVFRAERADGQVRQDVAIKVIKLGMDTREVIARFEVERQALALMEHPHIARMFDAGATETGRPYFVMELVHGEPISEYCTAHGLTIVQRLELMEQVCAAVQHAHTKGIIHRDIKPGNVIVSTQDGRPFAKIIDFGIAKATSGRLTEKTLLTEQFLMIGTALYMSPEQAAGSADIDTRTDIYALGVILYELLTDTTPIESDSLRTAAHAEVQRIIREVDPPRPSVRLLQAITTKPGTTKPGTTKPGATASGTTTSEETARGGIEPRVLVRMVRGELDWIVMKAIEKDRARRYETADALAQDVRRYLAGEAVLAAPPGARYRMRKFVRRHKGPVAAGSLIAAALLAGIVAFAWQARIAQQQTRIARQQALLAQQHASEVEQVAQFEGEMLHEIDTNRAGTQLMDDIRAKLAEALVKAGVPEKERAGQLATFAGLLQQVNATDAARDLLVNATLKPAVAVVDKRFRNQPVVAATLDQALADRYKVMGLFDAAMPLQQRALATRRRLLGDDQMDTLRSIDEMGVLLQEEGKPDEAEPYLRETMEKMRRKLGPGNPDTAESMYLLAGLLQDEGKLDEAESLYREALQAQRRALGDNSPYTLRTKHNLGVLLWSEHKLSEAEPYLRETLEKDRRVLGEDDPDTLVSINSLGVLLVSEGKLDEAERYYREGLENSRRVLGEDHPDTLTAIRNLGSLLQKEGKLDEAGKYDREGLEKSRRVLGAENPKTLIAVSNVGDLFVLQKKYAEAEKLLAPNEAAARKAFVGDPVRVALLLLHLGKARTGLGEFAAAQADLLEAQPAVLAKFGPKDKYTVECTRALVDLYTAWNAREPGKGHDASAVEWKKKLDALDTASPAVAGPKPSPTASH